MNTKFIPVRKPRMPQRGTSDRTRIWLPTVLALALTMAAGQAQTFTTLKSFGILTNVAGVNPQSTPVQAPDGTLYGTATYGDASAQGTVFKMRPDGSGFSVLKWFTNSLEGANPYPGPVLSSNVLYGTTANGGSSNLGTVFKIGTDGAGYTVLKNFTGTDGANPYYASLTLSGSVLYGATYYGGSSNDGTVFKLNTDGTGYTVLKNFTGSDGANPNTGLALSGSVLYGTTENGGSGGNGTVFAVGTDGTGFTVLRNFSGGDGAFPDAPLTFSGSALYGTTYRGGNAGNGTVFKINMDGTGFVNLHNFPEGNQTDFAGDYTNSDGAFPAGRMVLLGGVLYGTAASGGNPGVGTVFQLNTNGTGFTVLKNLAKSDGANPVAGLTLLGSLLYGTTPKGGSEYLGTLFQMNTNGTGYSVLKNFAYGDGAHPFAGLLLSSNALYGTTEYGGSSANGSVFKLDTDGLGYTTLHNFTATDFYGGTNRDGHGPTAGLILSSNILYGTARLGGSSGEGTVFAVNTDGTGFTVLHSFSATYGGADTNSDGTQPYAGLVLSGNRLYGTAAQGGDWGIGTVFAVNTDGTGFTTLHHFTAPYYTFPYGSGTNGDGAWPEAGLVLSGNTLYGTALLGGLEGSGTVFAMNTDGTGFTILHSFTASFGPFPATNSDGAGPNNDLVLAGNTLYGTATGGGSSGSGTVFALNTDGTGFRTLHSFAASFGPYPSTNSDGFGFSGGLILSGNTLFGTRALGGSAGNGTVFALNTDGTGFTILHGFTPLSALYYLGGANRDGASPFGGLVLSGDTLYGAAQNGGALGEGTVFSLSFPPQLSITSSGTHVILSWPTNFAGFDYTGYNLQSTTNLLSPAAWVTNSPTAVVIGGQNVVTNPISGGQKFYRLIQ